MRASRPATSGSSGRPAVHAAGQSDRLAGEVGAGQIGAAARGVALVEEQVEDVQHRSQPLGAHRRREGSANGSPDALILALARLIRWAIVASGTRNAAAISRVVRPPTARRVSGIADAGVSDGMAAHEHEDQRVVRRRRRRPAASIDHDAARSSRRRRASSRAVLARSCRRDATRMSQASGLSGCPSAGQVVAAASRASCTASSASAKSP